MPKPVFQILDWEQLTAQQQETACTDCIDPFFSRHDVLHNLSTSPNIRGLCLLYHGKPVTFLKVHYRGIEKSLSIDIALSGSGTGSRTFLSTTGRPPLIELLIHAVNWAQAKGCDYITHSGLWEPGEKFFEFAVRRGYIRKTVFGRGGLFTFGRIPQPLDLKTTMPLQHRRAGKIRKRRISKSRQPKHRP